MTPALDGTLELVGFVACIGIVFMVARPRHKTPAKAPKNEDDR
jgi:hypothetical protein